MSLDMQKQIRENAQDMQSMMKDLRDWTDDMAEVERRRGKEGVKLKEGVTQDARLPGKFLPPPRGKVEEEEEKKPSKKSKAKAAAKEATATEDANKKKRDGTKIKDYYGAWDKYDVDDEVEKLNDPEKKRELNPERYEKEKMSNAKPNAKIRVRVGSRAKAAIEIAADLKNEANEHFAASRWFEAAEHYTKALAYAEPLTLIDASEDSPVDTEAMVMASVLFANRALVHIKRADNRSAQEDCDRALELQPTNVKARFRRGCARGKLKKWEGAKEDLASVVKASPDDKKAQAELEYVTRMYTAELTRRRERACKLIADKRRQTKLPMRRLAIGVRTASAGAAAPGVTPPGATSAGAATASAAPGTAPALAPVPAAPRPKYVPKALRMARQSAPRAAAKGGGNYYAFERAFTAGGQAQRLEALRTNVGEKAEFLPELFRESLSAEIIAGVVDALQVACDADDSNHAFAAAVMRALPETKRFEVSLGLLAEDERARLDTLIALVASDAVGSYDLSLSGLD